jgi:hypothetical protein
MKQGEKVPTPKTDTSMAEHVVVNIMCIVFFDCRGLAHFEIVPTGQAVNQELYLTVLRRLWQEVQK